MSDPLPPAIRAARKLWRPKWEELPAACASCPFRKGNDEEWRGVLNRLAKSVGAKPVTKSRAAQSRVQIQQECSTRGDFACHGSVYDQDMVMRPVDQNRQCPGAALWYREGKLS